MDQGSGENGSVGVAGGCKRVGVENVAAAAKANPRSVRNRRPSMSLRVEEFRSNLMLILQSIYPVEGLPLLQVESEYLKHFKGALNLSSFENFFLLKIPKNPEGGTEESRTEAVLAAIFSVEPFSKYFTVRVDQDSVTGNTGCSRVFCTGIRNELEMKAIATLSTHSNLRLVMENGQKSEGSCVGMPDRVSVASTVNNEPCDEVKHVGRSNEQHEDGKSGNSTAKVRGNSNATVKIAPMASRRSSSRIKKPVNKYDAFEMGGARRLRNHSSLKNTDKKYIDLSQEDVDADPSQADIAVGDTQADIAVGDTQADIAVRDTQADIAVGDTQADIAVGDTQADIAVGDTQADIAVGDTQADIAVGDTQPDAVADVVLTDVAADSSQADAVADLVLTGVVADAPQADAFADLVLTGVVADAPRADAVADLVLTGVVADAPRADAVADLVLTDVAVGPPQADVFESLSKRSSVADETDLPCQPQTSMKPIRRKVKCRSHQRINAEADSRRTPNSERPRPITLTNHLGEVKIINISVPLHTCRLCALQFYESKPFIDHMNPSKMICDTCKSPFKSKCHITSHHVNKECRIYAKKRTIAETANTGDDCNSNIIAKKSPVCVDLTCDNDSSDD